MSDNESFERSGKNDDGDQSDRLSGTTEARKTREGPPRFGLSAQATRSAEDSLSNHDQNTHGRPLPSNIYTSGYSSSASSTRLPPIPSRDGGNLGYVAQRQLPPPGQAYPLQYQQSSHPPITTLNPANTAPAAGKKRKSMTEQDSPIIKGSSNQQRTSAQASDDAKAAANALAAVKRQKTSRACDPCRRKKIRCDVITDSEPPICAHCKQYGFDCTFFLPITETRWKKRKMEEEEATLHSSQPKASTSKTTVVRKDTLPDTTYRDVARSVSGEAHSFGSGGTPSSMHRSDTRIYGPTSLTYILHTSTAMPAVDNFDLRYHQTWSVGRSGEGFIQVHEQEDQDALPGNESPTTAGPGAARPETVEREVLERLVNHYFKYIAPMFPIVTESEFVHGIGEDKGASQTPDQNGTAPSAHKPSPILLYAICCTAATARDVPSHVFDSLRVMLNTIIRSDDVLSNASLTNIQALLIAGMNGEPHGRVPGHSMSAAWLRVSTAIRMAQDLGLHRAEAIKTDIQLRRRLWAACVISDRWFGLTLGLPFMIDVHDCDARLPGPEIFSPINQMTPAQAREAHSMLFMGELVKLSILLGKVTKTIYSPTGLIHTTDEALERLLEELDRSSMNIPPELVFHGADSDIYSGLLHLFHTSICMMFWRVFARIQYTVPAHLRFSLTVERWSTVTVESARSIEWLDRHETMYDSWMFVAYSITACALIQYHTWARRNDSEAEGCLKRLRDCVKRWDEKVDPGHMLLRRKSSEIIILLYEATQSDVPRNYWPLNPTAGVESRNNAEADAIVFRKDPSQPGGGLFIATQRTANLLGADIPAGTIVVPDPEKDDSNFAPTNGFPESGMRMTGDSDMDPKNAEQQQARYSPPFVPHMMPLLIGGRADPSTTMSNVNPNLNPEGKEDMQAVQMLNLLDQQGNPMQYAAVNNGLLDGIPATMFEFDQWDNFFQRFQPTGDGGQGMGSPYTPLTGAQGGPGS